MSTARHNASIKYFPKGLDRFQQEQFKIARKTLQMPDAMVGAMGGMTKAEARSIIARLTPTKRKVREFSEHNPPADIMREWRAGTLRTSAGKLVPKSPKGELQARAILLSELRREGRIPPRANPNGMTADDLYRTFHGRGPDQKRTLLVSEVDPYGSHPELAQLGFLVRFIVGEGIAKMGGPEGDQIEAVIEGADHWASEISFVPLVQWEKMENSDASPEELKRWLRAHGAPDVAAEPGAKQIYIVGGDQNIDAQLGRLGADDSKQLLDLGYCYFLEYFTQKRFDSYDPVSYYHHLGEKSKVYPRLAYDRVNHHLMLIGGEYKVTKAGIEN